ncbi:MAG: penicillin acylase family protein [Bacteroidales bacterium]|nr:penicillin acylase family protein [Bacteroidales bacterium]MBN2699537.1 penicillin acylase family protein [Bacteroidales bacterium]
MKAFKKILTGLGIVILILIFGGFLLLNQLRNRAIPDYNAAITLENLKGSVTVYRDSLAIPHIYADNEADLYRATGYIMAQDRFWQMDLMRRITLGRLSEIFGSGMIETDHLFRAFDFSKKSKMVIERTDPSILSCIEAFSDGVNQFIEQNRKKLSFEFTMLGYKPESWELIHTFNLIGYMAWDLTSGWDPDMALFELSQVLPDTLFKELIPDMDLQKAYVFPDFEIDGRIGLNTSMFEGAKAIDELGLKVFEASNNWAVSGDKSVTGKPFMCNDMHLGLMSPGIWYQMHQVVEGKLNVTGVALPGAPYIICGHNDDIAWGMTNVTVDNIDFYLETINPEDSGQYLLDGEWKDMETIDVEIKVKKEEPVIRTIRYTHRGPVVSSLKGIEDRVISARWLGSDFSNELVSVHMLNRAGNWEDFRGALKTFVAIGQNIVYADRFGNIGLQTSTGVPIREGAGMFIYPGDTSQYDWKGLVPFEELPYSFNPECGMVSSANNKTVGDDYPYYIGTWFDQPYRINRIREMLSEKDKFGTGDFKRMITDQVSAFAKDFTPVYLDAIPSDSDGLYGEARSLLEEWDYRMSAESPAPLIYEIMYLELTDALFHDQVGNERMKYMYSEGARNLVHRIREQGDSPWCDDVTTTGIKETFEDNIRRAFRETVDTLSVMYGDNPSEWQWGDLHKVSLNHPMGSVDIVNKLFKTNRGPYPIGGSYHTVCPYKYPMNESFVANHGASERHIFNTAAWDASLTVIPTGTSGVPASPHYLDQTNLYMNNRFHADYFTREAVERNALYKTIVRKP